MKEIFKQIYPYLILFVGAVLVLLTSTLSPLANIISDSDSQVYVFCAEQILSGKIMYKDIFDHKGPLLYLLNIIGLLIGGGKNIGIWLVEIVSLFVALIFIYKSICLFYDKFVALLSSFSSLVLFMLIFNGNLPEEYAVSFMSIAVYYFCKIFNGLSVRKKDYFIIAICFACVFFLKPNLTAIWMVGWLMYFILLVKTKDFKTLKPFITYSFLGAIVILVPFSLYFYLTDSFADFKFCYWDFNKAYSDPSLKDMFIRSIQRSYLYPIYRYCNVHIFLFSFLIVSIVNFKYLENKKVTLFVVSTILVSMIMITLSQYLLVHYYLIFVPIIGFAYAMAYHFFKKKIAHRSVTICIALFLFLNSLAFTVGINEVKKQQVQEPYKTNLISYIKQNTDSNDKITVFGNCCWVYSLSQRESVSRYAYVSPIMYIKDYGDIIYESYCDDVEKEKPRMIISDKNPITEYSRLLSIINSDYIQIDSSDFGRFECWIRK